MKKPIFEHIPTPDQMPNEMSPLQQTGERLNQSLREFDRQNKDLRARLSVQLRRNGELEVHIAKLEERLQFLRQQNEEIANNSLKNRERARLSEAETESIHQQLRKTEIELGELSLDYQRLREKHEQRSSQVEKRLKRFLKYRKKIQREVRPMINRLYEQNHSLLSQLQQAQYDRAITSEQKQQIASQMQRLENKHQKKILAAAALQDEIIQTYELERKQLQDLLDQRDIEVQNALAQVRYLQSFRDQYVVMENKAIAAERVRFETERKFDKKVSELRQEILRLKDEYRSEQEELAQLRTQVDRLREEKQEWSEKYFQASSHSSQVRGENQAYYVQWQESKILADKNRKQAEEWGAMNERLRQENRELRQALEQLKNPPQIPLLIPDHEVLQFTPVSSPPENKADKKTALAPTTQTKTPQFEREDLNFEDFAEIDQLIREIETGYPIQTKRRAESAAD